MPLVTLLMNWWVDRPYSAVGIPKSLMTALGAGKHSLLEAFHLSLKGTERSGQSCNGYKKVHSKRSFFDDLDVWQAQKLPQALSKLGHQRALLLQYASGGISSRTECDFHKFGLSIGNVTSDWPEWNILKSKKQDT